MILEQLVDGAWCYEGSYSRPQDLAEAAFALGKLGGTDQVKVYADETPPRVALFVQLGLQWFCHGSYTDLNELVRAIKTLCQNPDVNDFRVRPE